jgi:hypothetical protein
MTEDEMRERTAARERAKAVYTFQRRLLHPDYVASKKHDSTFEKVALWVMQQRTDLTRYVAAQFKYHRPFPLPNMLLGARAQARWERYKREEMHPEPNRLEVELDFMETRMRIGFTPEELLEGEEFPLTPAFRYLMADQLGISSMARLWREEARLQLLLHPSSQLTYQPFGEERISRLLS